MNRALAVVIALVSPFLFPSVVTFLVVLVAACIEPLVGVVAGILTDLLYATPGMHFPYATVLGGVLSLIGLFVQQFVKTRIMS